MFGVNLKTIKTQKIRRNHLTAVAAVIANDSGSAANQTRDQIHAVGGQVGLTSVPWMLSLNFLGFYEYSAQDRFQGSSFSVNLGKKF